MTSFKNKILSAVFYGKDNKYNFAVLNPKRWLWDKKNNIHYFNENELFKHKIHIENGFFYQNNRLLTTFSPKNEGRYKTHFLYAFGVDKNIYATPKSLSNNNKLYHSSILSGRPVICAGYIQIQNGRLIEIDNGSIHYNHPAAGCMFKLIAHLRKQKVTLDKFKIKFFSKNPEMPTSYRTAIEFLSKYPYH
jgi:hypothetical protein